ncbi:MAG: putative toxin-antitoxin system toxin component, PIN family [Candidatus Binatia bacterium]
MRVVLDTNVLVSALLFTGISSELVPLWQKGTFTVLLSREILEEYLRVLAYPKFRLSEGEIKALIEEELLPFVQIFKPGIRVRVVKRDPSDDKFLECAVAGKADVLISGDKDLLTIKHYRRVRIKAPSQFLGAFLRKQSR